MVRKTFIAAVAVTVLLLTTMAGAQAATWKSLAVNQQGGSWLAYNYGSEWEAKSAAIDNCENRWAYDCSQATSVTSSWTLVVAYCENWDGEGYYSTGGSRHGRRGAVAAALENANDNSPYWYSDGDCRAIRVE